MTRERAEKLASIACGFRPDQALVRQVADMLQAVVRETAERCADIVNDCEFVGEYAIKIRREFSLDQNAKEGA